MYLSSIASLTSGATTVDKVVAFIRLGPNTRVTLYPQPNYAGTPRALAHNDELADGITTVGSLRIATTTLVQPSQSIVAGTGNRTSFSTMTPVKYSRPSRQNLCYLASS